MTKENMEITTASFKSWKGQGQTLIVFAFQDEMPILLGLGKEAKILAGLAQSDGFKGRERETFIHRPFDNIPAERVIFVGLGKKADFDSEVLRRAASKVLRSGEAL